MDVRKYFSDYETFSENEVAEITKRGIALKNGMYVDFAVCAEVWGKVRSVENNRCIGERDVSDLSFTFYTLPKPIMIQFFAKSKIAELFSRNAVYDRFYALQKKIVECGYQTLDLS